MTEVRTMREGTLRFVQASGSGNTWATAATPVSGLFGYVQSFTWTSGQTVTTISERGTPDHHKVTNVEPIQLAFSTYWTGTIPTAASGAGASVPMYHLEFRATAAELGSSYYVRAYGVVPQSIQFTEALEGDTLQWTCVALGMGGPTTSGFLGQ